MGGFAVIANNGEGAEWTGGIFDRTRRGSS
jgi:hypothetical protein